MTDTKGTGIINTLFEGYGPYKGDIQYRKQGSLIAYESGETVTYGLFSAQERGTLFVGAGEKSIFRHGYRSEWKNRRYRSKRL